MKENTRIAVIGGTGKSGKYLVRELLSQGIYIKTLVRNLNDFKIESPYVEIIHGDVSDFQTVSTLLEGCTAVISTLGWGVPPSLNTIFTTATQNILRAMNELELRRYIVVTGLHVDTPFDKKGKKTKMATDWMYANYHESTQNRQQEYNMLLESELDWTLVRLPLIELTDDRREVKPNLENCSGDKISATDLANFLIGQLDDKKYIKKAPFLANI